MSLTIHGNGVLEGMTEVNIAGAVNASTIVTLTAANTVAIGAADSNTVYVVGTTPIAGYDSVAVGIRRTVVYTGITTLLHNAISHIVRGGVNKVTAIGDSAEWISLGGGNWFMLDYASSSSVVSGPSQVTLNGAETLTNKKISAVYILDKISTVSAATGTVTLNLANASIFNLTLTGNTTLALSNVPVLDQEILSIVITVTQGATPYTLTWFNGLTWRTIGGVAAAAPAANKTTEYIITSTATGAYIGRKGAAT